MRETGGHFTHGREAAEGREPLLQLQAELYGGVQTGTVMHRLLFGIEHTKDELQFFDAKAIFGAPGVDLGFQQQQTDLQGLGSRTPEGFDFPDLPLVF